MATWDDAGPGGEPLTDFPDFPGFHGFKRYADGASRAPPAGGPPGDDRRQGQGARRGLALASAAAALLGVGAGAGAGLTWWNLAAPAAHAAPPKPADCPAPLIAAAMAPSTPVFRPEASPETSASITRIDAKAPTPHAPRPVRRTSIPHRRRQALGHPYAWPAERFAAAGPAYVRADDPPY